MFGGGFLLFWMVKPEMVSEAIGMGKKSFDSNGKGVPMPNKEDAEIVLIAYTEALKNGEPASKLTELNKECMQEFGMRCYLDSESGKAVVCDVKGDPIITK